MIIMGCYFCKLLFEPTVCVTHESLFNFYYKWNQKKLNDPHFLSRVLSLYAGKTEYLLYELEIKYGPFPVVKNDTLYTRYMQRRLFNVYAEHTNRLQTEGIEFIFSLTKSFHDNLDILLNKAVSRYGADTKTIEFPLETVCEADIPPSNNDLTTSEKSKEARGTAPAKRHLTIITPPFIMSRDTSSVSPYNESTIDVISSDDFNTDTSCEWDIID